MSKEFPKISRGRLSTKARNGEIEVLRLFFTIAILLRHSQYVSHGTDFPMFPGGWMGVEFFFLTSGYLMASYEDHLPISDGRSTVGSDTLRYVWRKGKSLYPYLAFAIVANYLGEMLFVDGMFFRPFFKSDLKNLISSILNFIFPYSIGFTGYFVAGYSWYLSAMIWGMMLLFPLLRRNRDLFYCVLAPIFVAVGLGYYSWRYNTLDYAYQESFLLSAGLVRGMAEMAMGCICYKLCKKCRRENISLTGKGCLFLSAFEILCFAAVLYRILFIREYGILDHIIFFLMALVITIAFSEQSLMSFQISGKWANFIGKFSLALYLNSSCWSHLTARAWPEMNYYKATAIYVCLSVMAALLCMVVCALVGRFWRTYKGRICTLLIVSKDKNTSE